MQIVTWNCNMAFRKKKDQILAYNPDILVIQECEDPKIKGKWTELPNYIWVGDNPNKGLGVFTRNDIFIEMFTTFDSANSRYFLPIKVTGKVHFSLIAVWAMNDIVDTKKRYIGQVFTTLATNKELLNTPSIIIGDFNWNERWDHSRKPLYGNLADTRAILNRKQIYSAYHYINNDDFGCESDPTFFMHKKVDKPYHIDYIFASKDILMQTKKVWVGDYDKWIIYSDHMPLGLEYFEE